MRGVVRVPRWPGSEGRVTVLPAAKSTTALAAPAFTRTIRAQACCVCALPRSMDVRVLWIATTITICPYAVLPVFEGETVTFGTVVLGAAWLVSVRIVAILITAAVRIPPALCNFRSTTVATTITASGREVVEVAAAPRVQPKEDVLYVSGPHIPVGEEKWKKGLVCLQRREK